jgi:hypothetical protein
MREFHPYTNKLEGDRVKVPIHPADESRGYVFGTVIHRPPSDELIVQWDEKLPYMPNPSFILPAILI